MKGLCSSNETIHKNFNHFGNFLLSLPTIQASISLHVKAPENGGCGPLRELRLQGDATRGALDFRVLGPNGMQRSRGTPVPSGLWKGGFSDRSSLKAQRPSGRRSAGFGDPLGDPGHPGGTQQPRSGDGRLLRELTVRHRKPGCPADPGFRMGGAGRPSTLHFPAMAAPLPPCRGVGQSGTTRLREKPQEGLNGQGRRPQGHRPGPEGSRASGSRPETR